MKKGILFLLIIILPAFWACGKESPTETKSPQKVGLKDYSGSMQIGVRVDQEGLFGSQKEIYRNVFLREFNSGTVTCYPAWNTWTNHNGIFDLAKTNQRINFLEENGITQMMHLLIAPDQYFPEWFKNGTFSATELDNMMHHWIRSMITSNGNSQKVEVWNVVNESLSWAKPYGYTGNEVKWYGMGYEEDQSGLTGSDHVLDKHPVYVRKAFEYARKYTKAKLELRDSGAEYPNGHQSIKYKTFYQLVKHLLNLKTPLDAVGFQVHLDLDKEYNWQDLRDNIRRFKDLGLEVYLTEIDIGDKETAWTEEKDTLQKEMYYNLTKIALETGVEYMHFWGLRDGQDKGWRTEESPLLFDNGYQKKSAYEGVLEALQESN